MAVTTTTLGELLKRVYADRIEPLQNLMSPLHNFIKKAPDAKLGGDGLYFPVAVSGDEGYAYHAEDAALPASTNEVVKQARVQPKVFSGAVKITGLGKAISSGNEMSFAQGLQYNLDQKLKRMIRYKEGALFRDGTGLLAQFSGAPGATTSAVTVDTPSAQAFRVNMLVDVLDDSTGAILVSGARVTAVDVFASTVTFATDFSSLVGDNDGLYISGSQPSTGGPVSREITGLTAAIATSGTYLGISRTSYPEWQSIVVSAASTDIDEDRIEQMLNRIKIQGGTDTEGFQVVIHPNQMRKLMELAYSRMRFNGGTVDLRPGVSKFGSTTFIESDQCPKTTAFFGDFSKFQKFTVPGGDLSLSDLGGEVVKWVPGYDQGLAYWREYCDYAVRKPNSFARLTNLNDVSNA